MQISELYGFKYKKIPKLLFPLTHEQILSSNLIVIYMDESDLKLVSGPAIILYLL